MKKIEEPKQQATEEVEIRMRFPNREAMLEFCTWMCDGGGEQEYFNSMKNHYPACPIERIQYHPENAEFADNDARRYGKFMADNLIIVHAPKTP